MKHYEFPPISTIADLAPALVGREEIKLMDRGGYQVVDYLYTLPDTFPAITDDLTGEELHTAILRRECRGMLFDMEGNLRSRRLHKFFNMGEREETLPENIDFSKPHHILNKEDGSMVSPYVDPDENVKWAFDQSAGYTKRVFWGTMMGWTDVAQNCEAFITQSNVDYEGFAREMIGDNWTPIFEWCSPKSRIVLKHDVAKPANSTGSASKIEEARKIISVEPWV